MEAKKRGEGEWKDEPKSTKRSLAIKKWKRSNIHGTFYLEDLPCSGEF